MLDKDDMLEALFERHGIGNADWRRRLSRMADHELIERASKLPAVVIASWWQHPRSLAASGTPSEWLRSLPGEVIEIYCVCKPSVAAARLVQRTRHPGHVDGQYTFDALLERFQTQASFGPLGVGRAIEVSTESEPDIAKLLEQLGSDLSVG